MFALLLYFFLVLISFYFISFKTWTVTPSHLAVWIFRQKSDFWIKPSMTHAIPSVTTWQSGNNCLNMKISWNYSLFFSHLFRSLVRHYLILRMQMARKLSGNLISGWVDVHHVIFCAINQCWSNVMLEVISLFWLQWKSNVKNPIRHSDYWCFMTCVRTDVHFLLPLFLRVSCWAFMLSSSRENSAFFAMTSSLIEIPNLRIEQSISILITLIRFD